MAEAFVRGPLYSWLRDMLGQIFGHFYVFKVFMGLPQERAEGAEGQAEAEVFEADRAFKHGDAVQVIRVVPGEVTACFYGKGVAVPAPRVSSMTISLYLPSGKAMKWHGFPVIFSMMSLESCSS